MNVLFQEYLDSIYYEGYAEALAEENPTAFQFEYNQFKNLYSINDEPRSRDQVTVPTTDEDH